MLVRVDSAAVQFRQTIYPAREVALKPGRVDPRLVAFTIRSGGIAPYNGCHLLIPTLLENQSV